jgi:Tfp pilus assembly protein PilE
MTFAYKQYVSDSARECHCEAEGRGNLRRLDCFASLAMTNIRLLCGSLSGCVTRLPVWDIGGEASREPLSVSDDLRNRYPRLPLSKAGELRNRNRWTSRSGMTLTEMAIVIGIIAVMVGLTLPAVNMLYNSFETQNGAKAMINAALASAKSIAIKEQRYAGIRFQKRYDPNNSDPLSESQYMIFIVSDPNIRPGAQNSVGCRAVDGITPVKLPDVMGIMDANAASDAAINTASGIFSNTDFTVLFSPSGKLVIHRLLVRNRNNVNDDSSMDDVFNSFTNVNDNNIGMFIQDSAVEDSRNNFYIYNTKKFKQAYDSGKPYSGCLSQLKPVYVNSYTGTIVEQ